MENTTATSFGALEVSMEPHMAALAERYASRGIAKAVRIDAGEQIKRERKTRSIAPDAYRLSQYTDRAVESIYRRGKDTMDGDDLIRYFAETRRLRVSDVDFSVCEEPISEAPVRDLAELEEVENATLAPIEQKLIQGARALPAAICKRVKEGFPTWFDPSAADASANRKSFPLSAFASLIVVAMCLMLIVASNVMITRAEDKLNALTVEIDAVAAEVADLEADMNVQSDLLLIRDIAISEYGMIGEEYVRMDYVTLHGEDVIEAYEDGRGEGISLSALLSAIGIK
ncbi:MAG: hypothetical protein II369_01125 [Clostridia bacterium]|nr:hypothetical protein [Clostridia bacterium]